MKKLKNTRKLLIAATALVAAVAVSAGATYAWFTSNEQASISGIEATVKTGGDNSIMLAVGHSTTSTFKTGLAYEDDLQDYLSGNYLSLDAVTQTTANVSTGALSFVDVDGNSATAASTETSTVKGTYARIPITVKTDTPANIILDNDGSSVEYKSGAVKTVSAWEDISDGKYNGLTEAITVGNDLEAYADNAARVGFTSVETDDAPAVGGTESTVKVWSPNEAMYDGGEYDGTDTAERDLSSDTTNWYKNNLAKDYYNYINSTATKDYTQYEASSYVAPDSSTESDTYAFETKSVADSTTGYAFIYIYIWIEGTDGDCFNNILSQTISVEMTFKAAAETTGD